jgi:hypothetical protein
MKKGITTCHPERKHKAKGLCEPCYFARYHETVRKRRGHVGLARVPVNGWGFVCQG